MTQPSSSDLMQRKSVDRKQLRTNPFDGKVVWVTGASSGLGEALVRSLADHGASVILTARRHDALESVRNSCRNADRHHVLPLDLNDGDSLPVAYSQAIQRFSQVDILINNAGLSQRAAAVDTLLDVDRYIMNVNYFGTVALTKAVLPDMIRRGAGQIVAVSSLLGKIGIANRSAYAASKHALHGFFDSLRAEVGHLGIDITIACPGFVRTAASRNALAGDGQPHGQMDERTAGGLSPDECAFRILHAVAHKRPEVYIGREKFAVYLRHWAPRLFRRLAARTRLK